MYMLTRTTIHHTQYQKETNIRMKAKETLEKRKNKYFVFNLVLKAKKKSPHSDIEHMGLQMCVVHLHGNSVF